MKKETKTASELNTLVAMAVHRVAELANHGDTPGPELLQPGLVYWHEPDDEGRNWNMSDGRHLAPFTGVVELEVNKLRDRYELLRVFPTASAPGSPMGE